jgi:hypothetical protein
MTRDDLLWTVGFLEGEGSFGFYDGPKIQVSQVQRWPLERLHALYGGTMNQRQFVQERHKKAWNWALASSRAVGLMMTLYALMSPVRQAQIMRVLLEWRKRIPHYRYTTHCKSGHAFDELNTIIRVDGRRRCRLCRDRRNRARPVVGNVL